MECNRGPSWQHAHLEVDKLRCPGNQKEMCHAKGTRHCHKILQYVFTPNLKSSAQRVKVQHVVTSRRSGTYCTDIWTGLT